MLSMSLMLGDRSSNETVVFDYVTDYDGAFLTDFDGSLVQA